MLWGDEGLQVETQTLTCALIPLHMSTSHAFVVRSQIVIAAGVDVARFSSCMENVYKCKLYYA